MTDIEQMTQRRTALLISRGERLAATWRAMADDLARDYRVIVAIHEVELSTWAGSKAEIVVIDREMKTAAAKFGVGIKDEAARIEKEIGIPMWRSAQPYLLYRRFNIEYFGKYPPLYEREERVLEEYVGSYVILKTIFDRFQPDICFYEMTDLISHLMTLVFAYQRNVFCYGIYFPGIFGDGKVMLTYGVNRRNVILEQLYSHRELIAAESWSKADNIIADAQHRLVEMSYLAKSKSQIAQQSFISVLQSAIPRLTDVQTWLRLPTIIRLKATRRWIESKVIREPPKGKYVVFFLHYQPEASTTVHAPRWVDQNIVIERLATCAPVGWTILVKENPLSYGVRGRRYFGPLLDLPNVRLCHPSVSTVDLLRQCSGVLTVTGTVGLEGVLIGKRVVSLARPYYSIFEGVRAVDSEDDVFPALADKDWNPETMVEARRAFVAALFESAFDIGIPNDGKKWPSPATAGPKIADGLRRIDSFTQRYKIEPASMGCPFRSHVSAGQWASLQNGLRSTSVAGMIAPKGEIAVVR